jgi:hypothetical protein
MTKKSIFWLGGATLALAFVVNSAGAQSFAPYYGKNKVKYDNMDWHVYRSPHFEVYYYPEFEQELGRVVSYAESAYEKISNELKHEISFAIPMIVYKTFSEFAQTNLFPQEVPEGVLAFAEPIRTRLVLPIDEPPDKLQELITHELTHIFEFDIIPRPLIRQAVPLWVDEGLADYMAGEWDSLDLMKVRDAAVTDQIPSPQELNTQFTRAPYDFGKSIFEFMEERWGKEGVRQFLFALRKSVLGGVGSEVYQQAFRMDEEEFIRQYRRWLKERFKPFRDKEIPDDYSRNLAPDPRKGKYVAALSVVPSPSREILAVVSYNMRDGELDVVLLSAKDGSVIKNLTPGYTGHFEYIPLTGEGAFLGRMLSWTHDGDHVGFFGRYKKRRALILVNVLTAKVDRRIPMTLDQAAFPQFGPEGRYLYFSALRDGISDIYRLDLETEEIVNVTQDRFTDSYPLVSSDGQWLYYSRRVSGNEKIYRLKLENPEEREQLTFGTFDDAGPTFSPDGRLLFYSSNEDDSIYNLRSLDLETGDILQFTDVLGGNFAPAIVTDTDTGNGQMIFTSFYKGEYGLYRLDLDNPVKEIPAEQIARTEGPVIDFVPPVLHQVIPENKRKKGTFEKMFIDGPPPIAVGVTSSGDFYGGSGISFSDVLGDKNFTFLALSVREFRTYSGSFTDLSRRFQYSVQGFDSTSFFFATPFQYTYAALDRRGQLGTIRQSGATLAAFYPLDRFKRIQFSAGIIRQRSGFQDACLDPEIAATVDPLLFLEVCGLNPELVYQTLQNRYPNGTALPLGLTYVHETTRFRQFGPLAGSTVMAGLTFSPGGAFLSRRTFQVDARKYFQISSASLFAVRLRAFRSTGENPDLFWFGGNGEMRGYPFYSFVGHRGFYANAELRFPLVDVLLTPVGFFGGIRGTMFFNVGGAAYNGQPFQPFSSDTRISRLDGTEIDGWGLNDAMASYGIGLTMNLFGIPFHFDWTKLTDLSHTLPGWKFDFWMGYDF